MAKRNDSNDKRTEVAGNVEKVTKYEWINEGFEADEKKSENDLFRIDAR